MKKNILILLFIAFIMFAGLSCKKDNKDKANGTKAVFSYVADGFKVNFTDYSSNAKEYSWDFGDSNTSTSQNPVHIYRSKGEYLAKLTITNAQETSTFTDTVIVAGPNIKIDNDFSDWAYVDYSHTNPVGSANTLLGVKTFASASHLNFYLEGSANFKLELMDIFIDADNSPATGFQLWMYPLASGAEYLCEGNTSGGSIYIHTGGDNDGWSWDPVTTFDAAVKFSPIKDVDGKKAIEFSIKREGLGVQKNYVNFAIHELDAGYSIIGSLPVNQQPNSKFLKLKL